MNLLIVDEADFIDEKRVQISDRRFDHLRTIHKAQPGEQFKVGMLEGLIGQGLLIELGERCAVLELSLDTRPPAPLPVCLILALPRPKMLKRILQSVASMGVKELYLINSYRVDKSYWSTPLLHPDVIHQHLLLGLEQSGDTALPKVALRKRFKPFVEDELPSLVEGRSRALIAHPKVASACPEPSLEETLLAIGPEGGFIPYEVELMEAQGLQSIHLGQRILRVETAVPALLSRLFPLI